MWFSTQIKVNLLLIYMDWIQKYLEMDKPWFSFSIKNLQPGVPLDLLDQKHLIWNQHS